VLAWIAKSAPTTVVPRKDAQLGKLQVLSRTLRTQRARASPPANPSARIQAPLATPSSFAASRREGSPSRDVVRLYWSP
jgi:hypothetical protein